MFPESQRRVRCWRRSYPLAALLALPLLVPPLAQAQRHFGPGDERPELEPFEEPEELEGQRLALPPIPDAIGPEQQRLSAASRVYVAGYRVVGSTAFSEDELAQLTAAETRSIDRPVRSLSQRGEQLSLSLDRGR